MLVLNVVQAVACATMCVGSLMNAPPGFLEFLLCVPWANLHQLYPRFACFRLIMQLTAGHWRLCLGKCGCLPLRVLSQSAMVVKLVMCSHNQRMLEHQSIKHRPAYVLCVSVHPVFQLAHVAYLILLLCLIDSYLVYLSAKPLLFALLRNFSGNETTESAKVEVDLPTFDRPLENVCRRVQPVKALGVLA